jgi:preprotein translocase subunit SecG
MTLIGVGVAIATILLVLDCLFLMLLVLVQLPKKEAGMGQAFGGAATDALFGAGSGNALTKMTKYATVVFFVLTLSLSILNAQQNRSKKSTLERALQSSKEATPMIPKPVVTPSTNLTAPAPGALTATNKLLTSPAAAPTNAAPAPAEPAPADKGK